MLTIKGIARRFELSERAVRRWVASGVIPSTMSGNRAYIDPSWVRDKLDRDGTLEQISAAPAGPESGVISRVAR